MEVDGDGSEMTFATAVVRVMFSSAFIKPVAALVRSACRAEVVLDCSAEDCARGALESHEVDRILGTASASLLALLALLAAILCKLAGEPASSCRSAGRGAAWISWVSGWRELARLPAMTF